MTAVDYSTFRGWMFGPLGFSRISEFIGGRAKSVGTRGAHTMQWRGKRGACATLWCGWLLAGLRLPFGLRLHVSKIGTSAFVLSNSENISFSKNLELKTAENMNWHCGILLIG
jgi:hypothetical protein